MNRQKTFLLILLALFAVAAINAFFRMPKQKTVEHLKFAPGKSAGVGIKNRETVKSDVKKLNLELLDKPLPRFSGFRRNIFTLASFETKKKLPLPPPPPPLPPPPPPPPPETPSQIEQKEMANEMAKFTFLGFLLKEKRKTVFLAKDKEIFVVKMGDKIANKYEVTNISDNALTINSTTGGGQIVIPLIENKPLKAAGK